MFLTSTEVKEVLTKFPEFHPEHVRHLGLPDELKYTVLIKDNWRVVAYNSGWTLWRVFKKGQSKTYGFFELEEALSYCMEHDGEPDEPDNYIGL